MIRECWIGLDGDIHIYARVEYSQNGRAWSGERTWHLEQDDGPRERPRGISDDGELDLTGSEL